MDQTARCKTTSVTLGAASPIGWSPPRPSAWSSSGARFAIQLCLTPPTAGPIERFARDVKAHMLTSAAAVSYNDKSSVPTVMVGNSGAAKLMAICSCSWSRRRSHAAAKSCRTTG